jgi:WD40 repeat protein
MSTCSNTAYRPWLLPSICDYPPSVQVIEKYRRFNYSRVLQQPLDRANVLGTGSYGHTGYVSLHELLESVLKSNRCVNALSWAENGQVLLSGGDDLTIRLWRMDSSNVTQEYPFTCRAAIHTGHRANIFNVAQLPGTKNM